MRLLALGSYPRWVVAGQPSQPDGKPFDLNIERVLEHWTVAHALREVIANALDEQAITGTGAPEIFKDEAGAWHVRDFGRGLRREHLTLKENREKLRHPLVIGKFGGGLKDAFATFDRHKVQVAIRSPHGDFTLARAAKHGFDGIVTLHVIVAAPTMSGRVGTEVVLTGVTDTDIAHAKEFFLTFTGDEVLEETGVGAVLRRAPGRAKARIYVRGLAVAEEDDFLFSYNITEINTALRGALNRERTNVGRTAYTNRIQKILLGCTSAAVVDPLVADLAAFDSGRMHAELGWTDIGLHACRKLSSRDKVLFVTAAQLAQRSALIVHAQDDGCRLVVVPEVVHRRLGGLRDDNDERPRTLDVYRDERARSFQYRFVEPTQLTDAEQAVYELAQPLLGQAGIPRLGGMIRAVRVSETMRLDETDNECLGVWEAAERWIIVRRDQLADRVEFAGTLLHEAVHATSGADDYSRAFEHALTRLLGDIAVAAVRSAPPTRDLRAGADGTTSRP
jgi:hypothetical protein